jgi:molybdopterin converting factor subunit 1
MKVHVQFFSRLRDLVGSSEMKVEVADQATAGDLLEIVYAKTPALRDWDKSILVAVGVEFVERHHILQPEDQISIMPPVQGG